MIVGAFHMSMAADPKINRSTTVLFVKRVKKVLEDMSVFREAKVIRVVVLDQVIEVG